MRKPAVSGAKPDYIGWCGLIPVALVGLGHRLAVLVSAIVFVPLAGGFDFLFGIFKPVRVDFVLVIELTFD